MGVLGRSAVATVAIFAAFGSAWAADKAADENGAVESMFDVAFGAAVTSDYVSRGVTQSDGKPAMQGYAEFDYGIFYAGVWGSTVSFGGAGDVEFDVSAGFRPELDRFAFDFGYVHYYYISDPTFHYGEFYALVDATASDAVTLNGALWFAPNYAMSGTTATYVEGGVDIALPHDFGFSGALGYQQLDASAGTSYLTWNAGIYYALNDWTTIDLRYSDTNLSTANCAAFTGLTGGECGGRVMLSLSVDTAISSLTGGGDEN